MGLVYLASPYSSNVPGVKQLRFDRVVREAARMMREGMTVFSPISHSHAIDLALPKIEGHDFWMKQDIAILRHCTKLVVLMLDGWERSVGIGMEVEFARHANITIEYRTDCEQRTPPKLMVIERNFNGEFSE